MIEEDLNTWTIAIRRCEMERCVVFGITSVDIGLSIKKELDAFMLATSRCVVER